MRAIINIWSETAAASAGWKARAVEITGKNEATLPEILQAVSLKDGSSLYDMIATGNNLKPEYSLYANGFRLSGSSSIVRTVRDNVQIHVYD